MNDLNNFIIAISWVGILVPIRQMGYMFFIRKKDYKKMRLKKTRILRKP